MCVCVGLFVSLLYGYCIVRTLFLLIHSIRYLYAKEQSPYSSSDCFTFLWLISDVFVLFFIFVTVRILH